MASKSRVQVMKRASGDKHRVSYMSGAQANKTKKETFFNEGEPIMTANYGHNRTPNVNKFKLNPKLFNKDGQAK